MLNPILQTIFSSIWNQQVSITSGITTDEDEASFISDLYYLITLERISPHRRPYISYLDVKMRFLDDNFFERCSDADDTLLYYCKGLLSLTARSARGYSYKDCVDLLCFFLDLAVLSCACDADESFDLWLYRTLSNRIITLCSVRLDSLFKYVTSNHTSQPTITNFFILHFIPVFVACVCLGC